MLGNRHSWILDSTPWIPDSIYWIPDLFQWNLDSGFELLVGFRIPTPVFRIPRPRIPDSTSKNFQDSGFQMQNFPDSGIRIPLHGAIDSITIMFRCLPLFYIVHSPAWSVAPFLTTRLFITTVGLFKF